MKDEENEKILLLRPRTILDILRLIFFHSSRNTKTDICFLNQFYHFLNITK